MGYASDRKVSGGFGPIPLKKSGAGAALRLDAVVFVEFALNGDQAGHLAEVLCCCGEEEFVVRTSWSAQS